MANLKLKLEDPIYLEMDGTPEELAKFVKILRESTCIDKHNDSQNIIIDNERVVTENKKVELNNIITSTSPELPSAIDIAPTVDTRLSNIPTVEEVIEYIKSKKDYEHTSKELQQKYLGEKITYRDNKAIYGAFDRVIRAARKNITKESGIGWDDSQTRNIGGRTNVTVYRLIKHDETTDMLNIDTISQIAPSLQPVTLDRYHRKPEPTQNMYQ